MLPCEETVLSFIFTENNGLVAGCTGISAGLRYLSINSVKRGVVPDRNVLLKGICWTMPSMPWWVLKFAGQRPKAGGKKRGWGGWKRQKRVREIPPRRLLSNCSFLLPALFKSERKQDKEGKERLTDLRGSRLIQNSKDRDWRIDWNTGGKKCKRGEKRLRPSEDMWEETSREDIWLAGGKAGQKRRAKQKMEKLFHASR